MPTLPEFTRTIDNSFVTTWYEIRPEAIDNILTANVIWAALMGAGTLKTQVGSEIITRTIRYGTSDASAVKKGDVLSQGEDELETMAIWKWRYLATHVQRSLFDDQVNNGKSKIKDLVGLRLAAAREALEAKLEERTLAAEVTDETGKEIQGLNDLVPSFANRATGTYGGISRSNSWWQSKYKALSANPEVNLLADMKNLYNTIHANQSPPNLLVTTQAMFELYEDFALDKSQLIKDESTRLADLGFEVLRFKGKPLVWAPNMTDDNMLMLNMNYIEVVHDPSLWFDMTEWKPIPLQGERIAHILSTCNIIGTQPRRHGRLYKP
jgi:hypothetical protein